MKAAIRRQVFEDKFVRSDDPWGTYERRDEVRKRAVILQLLHNRRYGRILELGCGNGSNTRELAKRAHHVTAVDASLQAVRISRIAMASARGCRVCVCNIPKDFPTGKFDAAVIAELLYYFRPEAMPILAAKLATSLKPGAVVILAHHHVTFHDFVQPAQGIHRRLADITSRLRKQREIHTLKWTVSRYIMHN